MVLKVTLDNWELIPRIYSPLPLAARATHHFVRAAQE